MPLHTVARDCLYVNWAVPVGVAPPLPSPLRYEVREMAGDDWILVTALFFRFVGLRSPRLPLGASFLPTAQLAPARARR